MFKDGFLLIDKPAGITSHDVVSRLRYHLGTKKVGHAGTLDPMATGLLMLGIGAGTKLLTYAVGLDKTYRATIRLGQSTITDDAEGEFNSEPAPESVLAAITDQQILQVISDELTGTIQQVPSAVSAIKVNGVRSYAKVRAGEAVELAAREITIHAFEVLEIRRQAGFIEVDAKVTCSSGTYIRALARDLGQSLGVGGYLTSLRRTRIGFYKVEDAFQLPEKESPKAEALGVDEQLVKLTPLAAVAAELMPVVQIKQEAEKALSYGQWLKIPNLDFDSQEFPAAAINVTAEQNEEQSAKLVAILAPVKKGGQWLLKPEIVFPN